MTSFRYLFALGIALSVSACDSNRDDPVRGGVVFRFDVIDAPETPDQLGGPDLFLEIQDEDGREYLSTRGYPDYEVSPGMFEDGVLDDWREDGPPRSIYVPSGDRDAEFRDLNTLFRIEVRDDDGLSGSDLVGVTDRFTFREFAPEFAGASRSFDLFSADQEIHVRVAVDWVR